MSLIFLAGQLQNGKDSVADRLQLKLNEAGGNWTRGAFAYNVKKIYCDTFGVDMAFIENWKVIDECPPGFDMPVRQGLQFIGDGFRKIKSNIWIDLFFRHKPSLVITSDCRYLNEAIRGKEEGGLNILIGRPDRLNDDPNGSESQIRPYVEWALNNFEDRFNKISDCDSPYGLMKKFDIFIRNDGTLDDLYYTVDTKLVPYVQNFKFKEQE